MLIKNRVCIVFTLCILFVSMFSGCVFFPQTSFDIISAEFVDEDGFAGLQVLFNASRRITLTCSRMDGDMVFDEMFFQGESSVFIPLESYRITPRPGHFFLTVTDQQNNKIFEQEYVVDGGNLSIVDIEPFWCNEQQSETTLSLVGMNITLLNTGDIPVYPYSVDVWLENTLSSGLVQPSVVLPGQRSTVGCFVYTTDVSIETQLLEVSIKNSDGNAMATQTIQVTPLENSPVIEFSWQHNGNRRIILPNPRCLYYYYSTCDRFPLEDYAVYVFDRFDEEYTGIVAQRIINAFGSFTSEADTVNAVASFVQALTYAEDDPDDPTYEYPRFPVELLSERQGDCEDKSILLAALLNTLGFNVSLLRLPLHMAVGVYLKTPLTSQAPFIDEYYFLESTRSHWSVGMIPPEYRNSTNVTVYSLSVRPVLFHQWKSAVRYTTAEGLDFVKTNVVVENVGSGDAHHIELKAGFFTENTIIYNQESVVISSLASGEKTLVSLSVTVPQGVSTLLKTQLYWNRIQVHERVSFSWFSSKEF